MTSRPTNGRSVLMIAYHYPPFQGGSGIHRTLSFSKYLHQFDWQPIVLSASPSAYESVGDTTTVPAHVIVRRACALDAARHFAIRGRYPRLLAIPDRWATWWIGAVVSGLRLIKKHRPAVLWSTYPIATAHLIGLSLRRLSGLPWIADFRDSMTEDDYPRERAVRSVFRWIERETVGSCSRAVFTTPGAWKMYAERYPGIPADRWKIIENGYDEESFSTIERSLGQSDGPAPASPPARSRRLVLLHTGVLYPSERDPTAFFDAIARLKQAGAVSSADLRIMLRASGSEDYYRKRLAGAGIDDVVALESSIPHREAVEEMFRVDGLLLFQASNCNHQIPAKVYEYLRTRKPILALTDPEGDTATLLRKVGAGRIVRLDSSEEIAQGLAVFLDGLRSGTEETRPALDLRAHSRESRTEELARILDDFG